MSRREDPRLALYRSACQKLVRRGDVDGAAAVATAMLDIPGGRTALSRRLPVIAAEDVGARWLPAVVDSVRLASGLNSSPRVLVDTTAALAGVPLKSKAAYWLAATCWSGRHTTDAVTPARLTRALSEHDYRTAVATYIAARDSRQWRSGVRVIDAIRGAAESASPLGGAIVDAALWREALAGSGMDELIAAAVIALIDRPTGDVPPVPSAVYDTSAAGAIPWWAVDSHVPIGERALARVARRHGISAWRLGWIQFNCSSIVIRPEEEPSPWRDKALELDAAEGGWGTHAEGLRIWQSVAREVQSEIESELDRMLPS
jgi:hypothetical protein